jgi:hypothetical protein
VTPSIERIKERERRVSTRRERDERDESIEQTTVGIESEREREATRARGVKDKPSVSETYPSAQHTSALLSTNKLSRAELC